MAVTGTNGKTTTTFILRSIFEAHGWPTTVIGALHGGRTTPEAPQIQRGLADHVAAGGQAAAMEVSSPALVAQRLEGMSFSAAIFTNLGHDHIGEVHATAEDYFNAKASLFHPRLVPDGIVNTDDPWGARLAASCTIPVRPFGFADARNLVVGPTSSSFSWHGRQVTVNVPGSYNVANALGAATAALELGVDPGVIADGVASLDGIPGHFEFVPVDEPFRVVVDYAHTPEALQSTLRAARLIAGGGSLLVVFGCGGDRDRSKRPLMGNDRQLPRGFDRFPATKVVLRSPVHPSFVA